MTSLKRIFMAVGIVFGFALPSGAAPSAGPAGNFVVNNSTVAAANRQEFNVLGGTVTGKLFLPFLTAGQCQTTDATGKVITIPCGGGSASIAFTTGTSSGFSNPPISSPTSVGLFNGIQFLVTQQGGATAYFQLNTASVTLQGNNLPATYLTNSSATATYLQLSSATANFLTQSSATATYFQSANVLPVLHGGTGTSTPGLIAGSNITSITGTWPNQTINATSGGGGGGGSSIYAATSTASFPFGLSASTLAVTGSGNGSTIFTIGSSTYAVTSSSVNATVGHVAVFTSTNGTLGDGGTGGGGGGGTPAAPVNSVQYNNAGSFGGSNNFQWNGTSMTIISSVTITSDGTQNTSHGFLDVFRAGIANTAGTYLLTVGSNNQPNQFNIQDQTAVDLRRYGSYSGHIQVGELANTTNHRITDENANSQYIDWWNSGEMDIKTDTSGNGGKDIVLQPQTVEVLRVSNTGGVIAKSSATVLGAGGLGVTYGGTVSTLTVTATGSNGITLQGPTKFYTPSDSVYIGQSVGNTANSAQVCIGDNACSGNGAGASSNVAIGFFAGSGNIGGENIALGEQALGQFTTGSAIASNVAIGKSTLSSLTNPPIGDNVAIGEGASASLTSGYESTAVGYQALNKQTTPNENSAFGINACQSVVSGIENTGIGGWALANSLGSGNTALGHSAGGGGDLSAAHSFINGSSNIFIGYEASVVSSNTTTNHSIAIGDQATVGGGSSVSNAIAIGHNSVAIDSNTMVLGGVGPDSVTVIMSSATMSNGFFQFGKATIAQLATRTPTDVDQAYYCTDCTTDAVCISTGTGNGAFARLSARTTKCQ